MIIVRHLTSATLLAFALATFSPPTKAQASTDSRVRAARNLVQLLELERQMVGYQEQCIKGAKSASPESLAKDNPDRYGGVNPSSRHWPKVLQAYEDYYREMCARPTPSEFVEAMARAYANNMSMADLKAAIAFYSTDAGKRLVKGNGEATAKVYELVQKVNSEELPKAMLNFERRLEDIARLGKAEKCSAWQPLACLGL